MPAILRNALILFAFFLPLEVSSQISLGSQYDRPGVTDIYELFIQVPDLQEQLLTAPPLNSEDQGVLIQLPLANGEFQTFELYDAPLMQEGLANKYPEIRNFKGFDIDRPERHIRLNIGPLGVFAIIADTEDQTIIQPLVGERERHELYFSRNTYSNWSCETSHEEQLKSEQDFKESTNNCTVNGTDYYTYDIVVTTTGEFYNLNGGTMSSALNALTNRLAAMVIPYERDLAMTFQLVSNNDIVMFTDPSTDPFSAPTNSGVSIDEAENTIEANFSNSEYDIGHGYHEITCGSGCFYGGLAGVAVACLNGAKARGWTYQPNDIATNTVWSHEFGHQLSCWHTNYGCGNTGCHRYEPGEGATIMSTGAGCSNDDDYTNRVDFFHAKSIDAILEFTNNGNFNNQNNNCNLSSYSGWNSCAQLTSTGNTPPTVTANHNGLNLIVPVNTPFFLEGTATDPEGDPMTYTWEDYNTNVNNSSTPQNSANSTTAPLFRWFQPNSETSRLFPQLSSILAGNSTAGTGEVLPTVGRTMDFRFIARDNAMPYGALACDEITVTVDGGSGPFEITSQNSGASWTAGTMETITWNVNNTDQSPINAANVDILLSTDGGQNFNLTLASNTPNDGSHTISIPSVNTSQGRIKVQPTGNYIFFDINDGDITITDPSCAAAAYSISPTTQVTADEGDPALDLDMENEYGSPVTIVFDSTVSSDPTPNIAFESVSGGTCSSGSNQPHTKEYVVNVSTTGTYTISFPSSDFLLLLNLYTDNFLINSVCINWLSSTGQENSTGSIQLSNSFNENLNSGQDYALTVNGFSTGNTKSYTLNFSGPGDFYLSYAPVTGFSYTYAIVDDGSGNIIDFDPSTDLTNEPPGNYTIYGIHYDNNVNLTTYEGGAFSTFENDVTSGNICASISNNSRPVEIQMVLPLTFIDFQAEKRGKEALLSWRIKDAYNVSHFRVQRWKNETRDFENLGSLEWFAGKESYSFIDPFPLQGENLYRVTYVDIDGSLGYTPVRALFYGDQRPFKVYPTPANTYVFISGPLDELTGIRIYDMQGRLLKQMDPDLQRNRISISNLSDGIYFVEFRAKSGISRQRIMIAH